MRCQQPPSLIGLASGYRGELGSSFVKSKAARTSLHLGRLHLSDEKLARSKKLEDLAAEKFATMAAPGLTRSGRRKI